VTYDLTISEAWTLAKLNAGITFIWVSGANPDSTERGRMMWARVKGSTENALSQIAFKSAYMFRPGYIQPLQGFRQNRSGTLRDDGTPLSILETAVPELCDNDRVHRPRDSVCRQERCS
jgi:hypothetical protein